MSEYQKEAYKNLIVWQKADELAFKIYLVTKGFPKEEIFGLTSQMRRAAVSVPANILEGYSRFSKKEKLQFYSIARSSLAETGYYLNFSWRVKYLSDKDYNLLLGLKSETIRLLNGFIKSTK